MISIWNSQADSFAWLFILKDNIYDAKTRISIYAWSVGRFLKSIARKDKKNANGSACESQFKITRTESFMIHHHQSAQLLDPNGSFTMVSIIMNLNEVVHQFFNGCSYATFALRMLFSISQFKSQNWAWLNERSDIKFFEFQKTFLSCDSV